MALDATTGSNILKEYYDDNNLTDVMTTSRPTLAILKKSENISGVDVPVIPRYGNAETVFNSMADSQAAAATESSKWGRFAVTLSSKHGLALIDGDMIARCNNDEGSFVRAVTQETDGVINAISNRRAGEIFSAGWGEIGTIATGSVSGAAFTLARKSDVARVEKGQKLVFASTLNSSVLRSSSGIKVVSVDRANGIVTCDTNLSTPGAVQGDYVFFYGDRQNSATPARLNIAGFEAWIPPVGFSFSGDNFFGQDRSIDPTRLGGQRLDGSTGNSLEEVMQEADSIVATEGGMMDRIIVSPKTYKNIVVELGSRVRYQPDTKGTMGFSSLAINGQCGDIQVLADRYCPDDRMYGLQLNTWELVSSGKFVTFNNVGTPAERNATTDALEIRMVSRIANLLCRAPGFNINVKLASS